MLNPSIFRFFIFLLIGASLISCSSSEPDQPVAIETQKEADPVDLTNAGDETREDESIEIAEPQIEQKSISTTFLGSDPTVSNITFSAEQLNSASPAKMPSYQNVLTDFNQTKALEVAQQFGMGDQIFIRNQSGNTVFYAFQDGKRMEMFPGQVLFTDTTVVRMPQTNFSSNEVVTHVDNILAMWSWPTFDYQVVPISSSSAEVRRIINEVPVNFADMSIQVGANGELASFSLFMPELTQIETGQLVSAEEALNQLSSPSLIDAGIRFEIGKSQLPEFQNIPPAPLNSWRNRYAAGSKVNLVGSVTEYLPASGVGNSLLFLDRFTLTGAENMIDSLRQHGDSLVAVSGTILPDGTTLEVDLWSAADLSNTDTAAPLTGVIRLEDGKVFLDNSRLGNDYALIDPPADIVPESEVVIYQNFYFSNEDGRFIEWNTIELQNRLAPPIQENTQFSLEGVSFVNIDRIEIGYGRSTAGLDPTIVYAPVWHIYGSIDSGVIIVFTVPALK